jgi:two-component system, OmpR family, response regulator
MLVLARRLGEKIVLPSLGITVQVVSIKGNVVRVGIDAPPGVKVLREELVGKFGLVADSTEPEPCPA